MSSSTMKHRKSAVEGAKQQPEVFGPSEAEGRQFGDDSANKPAMDPSVAALFDGTKSTDQEYGTDAKDIAQQANACREALRRHLTAFSFWAELATKIALGDVAGLGKAPAKTDPYHTQLICNLAKLAVELAWKCCGGAGQVQEVLKMAKEELL